MNREIKFRGKTKDTNQWVYGFYYFDGIKHWILTRHQKNKFCHADEVVPETVGQYTGECIPECGEMIYEDEIIEQSYINKLNNKIVIRRYHIIFEKGHYVAKCIGYSPYGNTLLHFMLANYKYFDTKIVGNKHENPDLLEA